MLHPLRAAARLIDRKIGWNWIGLALSLVIIAAAADGALPHAARHRVRRCGRSAKTTELYDIVLASSFVAAGYFTLTFYDLFALRTIGARHIPYRIAALGGFTSYSIGHNVGASVFTGGAVRYRVDSAWGLTAIDVAKICFIAGLTFWLGNVAVLGLGIAYLPSAASAIDQCRRFNRIIAFAALGLLSGYVAWVWLKPRVIGRSDWVVTLPGGPLTLLQIVIGIVDLSCCALAMYVLLPEDPHVAFIKLAVIFVSATLLGFASSSPGGLGVFDAAMLVALIEFDARSWSPGCSCSGSFIMSCRSRSRSRSSACANCGSVSRTSNGCANIDASWLLCTSRHFRLADRYGRSARRGADNAAAADGAVARRADREPARRRDRARPRNPRARF